MTVTASYGAAAQLSTFGSQGMANLFSVTLSGLTVDATGEGSAMIGRICLPARTGSKTISSSGGKLHVPLGAVTWANGATSMDVGLQDLTGSPFLPDDTFDVKATVVPGVESLTANVINTFTMESGTKTINHNDQVALVFKMTARAGADSVIVNNLPTGFDTQAYTASNNAVSWAVNSRGPNALIEFDDGTIGWFYSSIPFWPVTATTVTYASNTAGADEYGTRVKLPWAGTLEALSLPVRVSNNSSDFEVCIYTDITGTPTHVTGSPITVDASLSGAGSNLWTVVPITTPIDLAAGTVYGITVRPTTTNTLLLSLIDYGSSNNAKLASNLMGIESYRIKRLDNTGAFTLEDSIVVPITMHMWKLSDGAGGSGGGTLARLPAGVSSVG